MLMQVERGDKRIAEKEAGEGSHGASANTG